MTVTLSLLAFYGCGGGGGETSSTPQTSTPKPTRNTPPQGTAQLGNLANAHVKIFEITDDGKRILKWKEKTSNGDTLEKIGKFNLHADELKPNTFYLYAVKGGEDWDADDNGIKDKQPTKNKGVVRAIAKGSEIKEVADEFKVTIVSEIVFEKVAKTLKYDFDPKTFEKILQKEAASVILDIDNNGEINNKDIIKFHPHKKRHRLKKHYRKKLRHILFAIHDGKPALDRKYHIVARLGKVGFAHKLALSKDENKLFVAGGQKGIFIVDITKKTKPKTIENFATPGIIALDVALSADISKAYIVDKTKGLLIVDINASQTTPLGSFETGNNTYALALSKDGKKAYITAGKKGVFIVDITDAHNPLLLGNYDTNGACFAIAISNDEKKAYIADGRKGLKIIDVSDPANPYLAGSYKTRSNTQSVVISKDATKAYVSTGKKGIAIIDVEDVSHPTLLGRCDTNSTITSVTLSKDEKKIYATDNKKGMVVIDVSDAKNPTVIDSYFGKRFSPHQIVISHDGTKAYVANGKKGITIVDLDVF